MPAVVIGGGEVAFRKIEVLLDAGAEVTLVSPALHPGLEPLVAEGKVRHIARELSF
jgi:siroheme synthase (precorrin-2 oxidase/ferrochelatase)